jgi:hypothetical protein
MYQVQNKKLIIMPPPLHIHNFITMAIHESIGASRLVQLKLNPKLWGCMSTHQSLFTAMGSETKLTNPTWPWYTIKMLHWLWRLGSCNLYFLSFGRSNEFWRIGGHWLSRWRRGGLHPKGKLPTTTSYLPGSGAKKQQIFKLTTHLVHFQLGGGIGWGPLLLIFTSVCTLGTKVMDFHQGYVVWPILPFIQSSFS